jgi:hypothetical protein
VMSREIPAAMPCGVRVSIARATDFTRQPPDFCAASRF